MKIKSLLSVEFMEAEFLKAEWYLDDYNQVREQCNSIVVAPDLSNPEQNKIRKYLLHARRQPLLDRIPADTKWYLGELEGDNFSEMLIVKEATWEPIFRENKKLKDVARAISLNQIPREDPHDHVGKIKRFKNRIGTSDFYGKIIVIASDLTGPYTVFEGNHRAVAFQMKVQESDDKSFLPKEIIVGHSLGMAQSVWLNSI